MSDKLKINKYWIPFWVDKWLFGSTRIELEPDERSVWLDLLALASKNEGYIRANENTPYPDSQLAGLLVIPTELLQRTIDKCIQYNKIAKLDNGTYQLANWEKYQLSKRHKRRFKEKKRRVKNRIEENSIVKNRVSKEKDIASSDEDIVGVRKDRRNKDLQSVIDHATSLGFGIQGSKKQNRNYAWTLMNKKDEHGVPLGAAQLKEWVTMAVSVREEQYAPQINNFQTLFNKWQDLLGFVGKRMKGGRIG